MNEMRKTTWAAAVVLAAGMLGAKTVPPQKTYREERAIQQTAKWTENWWMKRFEASRKAASNEAVKVVFLGDSITHNWETKGAAVWKRLFAEGAFKGVNCGFSGDCTEHVLWRLENGQLDGCCAKAVCLMIGTNNTHVDRSRPGCTARGVRRIVAKVQEKLPGARIVLMPIFPRGAKATEEFRLANDAVNREIRSLADGKGVIWLDFTGTLVDAEGNLAKTTAGDLLHPEAATYEVWAERLIPVLKDIFAGKETIEPAAEPAFTALPPTGLEMPVRIWPEGKTPDKEVRGCSELYFFQPLIARPTSACLIIVSGGGYSGNNPRSNEAYGAAQNFLTRGIHVAILNYRTVRLPNKPVWWASFQDAQRAIRVVKDNAARYGYATNNVSFCGYSAGGHLTLMAATSAMTPSYEPVDEIDRKWTPRLCHAIPVYPAYVCGFVGKGQVRGCEVDTPMAPEFKFDAWTPPMTLFHGDLDPHTAMACVKVYTELRRRNIPAELHVFGGMSHGFGGSIRSPGQNTWSYSGWELHAANRLTHSTDIHLWPDLDYGERSQEGK